MTRTAVILARGLGMRMRRGDGATSLDAAQWQAAEAGLKAMVPVGRPLLEHILTALADAGITDVVLVIGPEHSVVREHFAAHPTRRVRLHYAVQAEPRGTADAVAAAKDAVGDAPFLVLNADNWYPPAAVAAVAAIDGCGIGGFEMDALVRESNIPAERVLAFALLDVAPDGTLREIVEKPPADHPLAQRVPRTVSMNIWRFTPAIFGAIADVTPSPRGELELADAVRIALSRGERFTVAPLACGVLDLSSRGDVAAVAERLASRPVAT